jgi:hypothetical protein
MPRLSNNSVSVRGQQPSYQRDQVDNEAAPANSGKRMRQRGRQSETRGLTFGSFAAAGQTRSHAWSAANSRPVSARLPQSSAARATFVFPWHPPFTSEPSEAKSRHGPSVRAVIRITGPQKNLSRSPVTQSGGRKICRNPRGLGRGKMASNFWSRAKRAPVLQARGFTNSRRQPGSPGNLFRFPGPHVDQIL